jgi:hypothetical protein
MREHAVVLCIQDSTEIDFNGQAITGLGPLSYEAQRGMYLHTTYAVTLAREPLGVLDAWRWAREPKDANGERGGVKESIRGTEGYERVAERAADLPTTRLVYVADREADIAALMARARDLGHPADWLIRSQHSPARGRQVLRYRRGASVTAGAPLGEVRFTLPSRHGQKAREVRQQVWAPSLPQGAWSSPTASGAGSRRPVSWRGKWMRPRG